MKCPICNLDMRVAERESVDIDYCPQCRGVWLDRGELEKIIAQVESQGYRESDRHDSDRHDYEDDDHHDDRHAMKRGDDHPHRDDYQRKSESRYGAKRKEGFLSQLFDVFGD